METERQILIRHKTQYYQRYSAMPKAERDSLYGKDLLDKIIGAVYRLHEIESLMPPVLTGLIHFPVKVKFSPFFSSKYNPKVKKKDREGYAVGESKDRSCFVVIWEGTISRQTYHKDFIEILKEKIA